MKLYTKIFLSFFILIAAAFCLCGTWMISASFDAAKKREIQMGMSRNELYRTTFRSAADSVPADYFTTHHSLREIVVALKDGMDDKNGAFCLYDENKNIVYSTIEEKQDVALLEKVDKQHKAYKIEEKDGKYTLRVVSYMMLSANFKGYYVETQTNIGSAYTQRQDMVRMYHYIVCVVLLCCVIVSLILSYFLTYRIRGLSLSARAFADGDMDRRALVRGKDEVAVLSADFNQMADSLQEKMQELEEHAKSQEAFTAAFAHELKTPLTSIIGFRPSCFLENNHIKRRRLFHERDPGSCFQKRTVCLRIPFCYGDPGLLCQGTGYPLGGNPPPCKSTIGICRPFRPSLRDQVRSFTSIPDLTPYLEVRSGSS